MSAGCAAQELGVGQHAVPQTILAGIFTLGFHIRIANIDRADFVPADAAGEDFFTAGGGIEEPLAILLHQRNGKRPTIRPDFQRDVGIRIGGEHSFFRQVLDEHLIFFGGLDHIG